MTNTPAGWHPDPEDPSQLRYWDGDAWTEHRSPAGPGTPGGGYYSPPQSSGKATTALVLGVVSLIACGIFTGIPAMILGKQAAREIDASGGRLEGRGLATAGFVTGLIATILSVLALLLVIGVFAIGSTTIDSFEQSCQSTYPSPGPVTEDC
jgi:hypothetical protein